MMIIQDDQSSLITAYFDCELLLETHFENTPIQICRKFHLQKTENF